MTPGISNFLAGLSNSTRRLAALFRDIPVQRVDDGQASETEALLAASPPPKHRRHELSVLFFCGPPKLASVFRLRFSFGTYSKTGGAYTQRKRHTQRPTSCAFAAAKCRLHAAAHRHDVHHVSWVADLSADFPWEKRLGIGHPNPFFLGRVDFKGTTVPQKKENGSTPLNNWDIIPILNSPCTAILCFDSCGSIRLWESANGQLAIQLEPAPGRPVAPHLASEKRL